MKKLFSIILLTTLIGSLYAHRPNMIFGYTNGGFFSCFFAVLNHLSWCEKNNVRLIVNWGKNSHYYQDGGYNGSTEPWEYYFYPVSGITCHEALRLHKRSRAWRHKNRAPDKSAIPQTLCTYRGYKKTLEKPYRRYIHSIIKKYIKIKPQISQKIDVFYDQKIRNRPTVGIHLRGTDKQIEVTPVSAKTICDAANELAASLIDPQFFIATDDARLLEQAKSLLNGPVVTYDSFRSTDGNPIHMGKNDHNRVSLGEEVLIETLLLSRCDKFVHTRSNVSSAALFFNPELENRLVFDPRTCPLRFLKMTENEENEPLIIDVDNQGNR